MRRKRTKSFSCRDWLVKCCSTPSSRVIERSQVAETSSRWIWPPTLRKHPPSLSKTPNIDSLVERGSLYTTIISNVCVEYKKSWDDHTLGRMQIPRATRLTARLDTWRDAVTRFDIHVSNTVARVVIFLAWKCIVYWNSCIYVMSKSSTLKLENVHTISNCFTIQHRAEIIYTIYFLFGWFSQWLRRRTHAYYHACIMEGSAE